MEDNREKKTTTENVLCRVEGEVKIISAILGVQLRVVEGVRVEVVDEGAEGQPVVPAGGEVGHLDVLREGHSTTPRHTTPRHTTPHSRHGNQGKNTQCSVTVHFNNV